jgi:hypothetical protein
MNYRLIKNRIKIIFGFLIIHLKKNKIRRLRIELEPRKQKN